MASDAIKSLIKAANLCCKEIDRLEKRIDVQAETIDIRSEMVDIYAEALAKIANIGECECADIARDAISDGRRALYFTGEEE